MQKIELFQQTIDAWLNKDIKKLLIILSEDILWTEYFGAQYQGKAEIEKWFCQWINIMWIMRLLYSHGLSGVFMKVKKAFLMEFLLLNFPEIKFVKFKNLNKNMKNFGHF